jgi:Protein of unknown function (DUF1559)
MAVSSSFKQQCPSCEALVPIKDGSFIGKKVDCPKCKYRFVVEDPVALDKESVAKGSKGSKNGAAGVDDVVEVDDAVDDVEEVGGGSGGRSAVKPAKAKKSAAPKPAEDDGDEDRPRKAKQKKQSGNNTLIIGLGLAAVGLVVLAAAAIFLAGGFGSGGSKSTNQASNQGNKGQSDVKPGRPVAGGDEQKADQGQTVAEGGQKQSKKQPAVVPGSRTKGGQASVEHTNFLPRTTEAVYHCYFKDLLESPIGTVAFRSPGSFTEAEVKKRLGISILDVDDLLTAESYSENWTFCVIHTTDHISDMRPLMQAMNLKKWADNTTTHECYELQSNGEWVMAFSKLALFVPTLARNAQPMLMKTKPVLLHLRDNQTLIFANPEPMLAYLKVNGRIEPYPENVGKLPSAAPPKAPDEKQKGGGAASDDPANKGDGLPPGLPPGVPTDRNGNPIRLGAQGGGGEKTAGKGGKQGAGPGAIKEDPTSKIAGPDPTKAFAYLTLRPPLRDILIRAEVKNRESDKLLFSASSHLRAAMSRSKNPDDFGRLTFRTRFIWDVVNLLEEKTDRIEHVGMAMLMRDISVYQFNNLLTCSTTSEARQLSNDVTEHAAPQVVGFFKKVAGLDIEQIKAPKPKAPKAATGGGQGGSTGGGGAASSDDSMKGGAGSGGQGGNVPPGVPPRPPFGGPPGSPGNPGGLDTPPPAEIKIDDNATHSRILVTIADNSVKFRLDLVLPGQAFEPAVTLLSMMVLGLKAETDLAGDDNFRWRLAEAGKLLGEKGLSARGVPPETFPPGAFARPLVTKRTEREPANRISWMAALLPYMGRDSLYNRIDFNKSWRDSHNWMAARTLVPEFIDPNYPYFARYATYPGMPLDCAGTHYVGIGGVGSDAADAAAGDPAMIGKLGIFGYDRATPLKTIQEKGRGLANTVLMIRVPHDGAAGVTPWMAGGGSTVRNVRSKNSLEPFLSTEADGQRGTYAVMADGSVRFLKKGMSDEVFKAICTVDGPAPSNFFLDDDYPPLKEPKKTEVAPIIVEKPVAPTPGSKSGGATSEPAAIVGKSGGFGSLEKGPNGETISKEGRFSIRFPGTADVKTAQMELPAPPKGKVTLNLLVQETDKDSGYIVIYQDIPPTAQLATPEGINAIFEEARQGFLISLPGAKFGNDQKVSIAGKEGREWMIEGLPNDGKCRMRIVIVNQRLYLFGGRGPAAMVTGKGTNDFFDSFTITN